jgi:hypothetical protein
MALKDLPASVALNILQLIKQAPAYVNALAESKTGKGSKPRPVIRYGNPYSFSASERMSIISPFLQISTPLGNPVAALQSWYDSNIKTKVTISSTDSPTIGATFISIADWENNFFLIRNQIVSVIAPGEQPVITALDEVWKKFQAVSGRWKPDQK